MTQRRFCIGEKSSRTGNAIPRAGPCLRDRRGSRVRVREQPPGRGGALFGVLRVEDGHSSTGTTLPYYKAQASHSNVIPRL